MSDTDWKVHKFGGTSLADAGCFRQVAEILHAETGDCQAVEKLVSRDCAGRMAIVV